MLIGQYVGLRAIEPSDLPQLMEWRNRTDYRCYFREYRELSLDKQKQWYEKLVLNDQNTIMFAIVERTTNRLLGASGLCYINWVNRSADFSIYIGADNLYIDEKFAPDAAKIMAQYAFNELNMHRLWAEVYAFDQHKITFFKKLGFVLDGKFRETYWHNGAWHDSLFFAALQHEWVWSLDSLPKNNKTTEQTSKF